MTCLEHVRYEDLSGDVRGFLRSRPGLIGVGQDVFKKSAEGTYLYGTAVGKGMQAYVYRIARHGGVPVAWDVVRVPFARLRDCPHEEVVRAAIEENAWTNYTGG